MKLDKLKIYLAITIIATLIFFSVVTKMLVENGQCADDPFRYSARKLSESGGNYLCSCASLDPELLDFSFDEEGINILPPKNNNANTYFNPDFLEVNLSDLN